MNITLDLVQTIGLAAVILFVGQQTKERVSFLQKYFIPTPVIGGLLYALLTLLGHQTNTFSIQLDHGLTKFLMVLFFTCTGFLASVKVIKSSGKQGAVLAVLSVVLLILQDTVGAGLAQALGLHPLLGVAIGSVSMSGGLGSAAAFGPSFEALGVDSATVIGIAAATFGLIMGSLIGGPIAKALVEKHGLTGGSSATVTTAIQVDSKKTNVTPMTSVIIILATMAFGAYLVAGLNKTGITFPYYVGGVFAAAIVRNVADARGYEIAMPHINLIGNSALNLFLALSLMGLQIWKLFDLAVPMMIILLGQLILMACFAYFVIFKLMGKDYEAAVMSAGHCGVGLGQTPNAIANMSVVIEKYGAAPNAWVMLPVITVIVINLVNPLLITFCMNLLS
ncbi:sodium/glutamate symporter [Vibrio sp. DW001]|uniref:sodium/glutamate symporter n=1 Tax=Vibrio sp. DW001 TaxID=2912315 RepID=UPI0023AF7F8F|nr:sodium/glutamate symporter [Vibrio sp. DW001]WED25464.1 sodium/glutamate symporter [Vibrio sp. DW001]